MASSLRELSMRYYGFLLAFSGSLFADSSEAQDRHEYFFYHGDRTNPSSVVEPGGNSGYQERHRRQITRRANSGDSVCVNVVNAHPVNYGYTVMAAVDTTGPKLPDLSKQEQLFAELLKLTAKRADLPTGASSTEALRPYLQRLDTIAAELDTARAYARESDTPEPLAQVRAPVENLSAGFRRAQFKLMSGFSPKPGHLNDRSLSERTRSWAEEATKLAGADPVLRTIVLALKAYGDGLVSERNQLRNAYGSGSSMYVACGQVGKGTTTFNLQVAKKDTAAAAARSVGKDIALTIIARPRYARPLLALHPVAFAVLAKDVPEFQVENGVLRGPAHDETAYRVGGLVNLNIANFGPQDDFGVGIGLGTGIGTESNILTDLFVATLLSYHDAIRLGIGTGTSKFPKRVKSAEVGQPLPSNAGKLEDLIEDGNKSAFYIIFVLPGLKLK